MEKIHRNMRFCAYMLKFYIKAQKHACFHVFFPSSAAQSSSTLSPALIACSMKSGIEKSWGRPGNKATIVPTRQCVATIC